MRQGQNIGYGDGVVPDGAEVLDVTKKCRRLVATIGHDANGLRTRADVGYHDRVVENGDA